MLFFPEGNSDCMDINESKLLDSAYLPLNIFDYSC